jgi:hypothetical protein
LVSEARGGRNKFQNLTDPLFGQIEAPDCKAFSADLVRKASLLDEGLSAGTAFQALLLIPQMRQVAC